MAALALFGGIELTLCQQPPAESAPPDKPGVLSHQEQPAYKDARQHRRGYFGAGREEAEPQDLNAVLIGYFGPSDPGHPEGGSIWQAVNLAIEESNTEGGYKGLPFQLMQGWAENPWADGVSKVVRMAYLERVWGIIGSIDGASTHLAEQVVAKARVPLIDPASTDDSVNQANVAWMFSCLPGDRAIAKTLGGALLETAGSSFVLLTSTDHDSRALTSEFKAFLSRKRVSPKRHIEFAAGSEQVDALAAQAVASGVKAVVVFAGAEDSARVVRELRRRDKDLPVFGGPAMSRRAFVDAAGAAAEGVWLPLLIERSEVVEKFELKYRAKYGDAPDFAAVQAYDAVRLLVGAIRRGGLNRTKILDALNEMSPWRGTAGILEWDALGRNARKVQLGVIRGGGPAEAETGSSSAR
jgi:branched-chain amino acid transport system substrate-binding protein